MIAVVVAAHNEESLLPSCLDALERASAHPGLEGEPVLVFVVLDSCTDGTAAGTWTRPVVSIATNVRNVGAARRLGADAALARGARWLAFTDADTVVADDWLVAQLGLGAEAVCGTVAVDDWHLHPPAVGARFVDEYQDRNGHRHVHGANLGLSRDAYLRVGGFEPLEAHEDVALVRALEGAAIQIAWSAVPRVVTSSRARGRAPAGFAAAILAHHEELLAAVS